MGVCLIILPHNITETSSECLHLFEQVGVSIGLPPTKTNHITVLKCMTMSVNIGQCNIY